MRHLAWLLLLPVLMSCGGKDAVLAPPEVAAKIPAPAALYVAREMREGHVYGVTSSRTEYGITSGVKDTPTTWGQDVGRLSADQFELAARQAFDSVTVLSQKPSLPAASAAWKYLLVPAIEDMKIEVKRVGTSWMDITYRLDVFDPSGRKVFTTTERVEESGMLVKPVASSTSVFGIPVSAEADPLPDESQMIFDAIKSGVDACVNKMLKSLAR